MTRRPRLPLFLIGIGSLFAILAILALWANRQLLDTDNWVDTSSELHYTGFIATFGVGFAIGSATLWGWDLVTSD